MQITESTYPDLSSILGLLAHFKEFVDSCIPYPPEPKRALIKKIELAISQFEKDNERPTVNALRSFIHKTEQFVRSEKLPEAEGRRFIALYSRDYIRGRGRGRRNCSRALRKSQQK